MPIERRQFLKTAGSGLAALTAAQYSRVLGANDRVGVAVVGVGGRGKSHIAAFAKNPGSEVRQVVDIDQGHAETAVAYTAERQDGMKPKELRDMRDSFASKDIDVVSIATPNFWHALSTIWACQAGKDVYVEKPASHNIFEGRQMVEAARKYKRMVQVGQQSRSTPHKIEGVQKLKDGIIGEVYMAKGLCFKRRKTIGSMEPSKIPPGVDYDLWLGPTWPRAWQENRFHYNWHWYWDFGNGDIGNQGVHEMDVARWGLGLDLPDNAFSEGGKFVYDDDQQTPNTQIAVFRYPKQELQFEVRGIHTGGESGILEDSGGGANTVGVLFLGSDGYMTMHGRGYRVFMGEKREPGEMVKADGDETYLHVDNFLKACHSRKHTDLNCDIEIGHISAALCHMANISYRVHDKVLFNPASERFIGNDEANKLVTRDYRPPFVVPDVV
ncbi:MAG: gfo/Idh/MocA family oxidoreductase [Acidobacteria bacterium]|nr:gfo/Idh/MocA family oxidoreductase [Acidobacteriota bacterium]